MTEQMCKVETENANSYGRRTGTGMASVNCNGGVLRKHRFEMVRLKKCYRYEREVGLRGPHMVPDI